MPAALRSSVYFCTVFSVSLISLAFAQDENLFIYNGFVEAELHLDGAFIHSNELLNSSGHGMAFVISRSMDFSHAADGPYLGLFNFSNNGFDTNHIFAVELDTVKNPEFKDIDGDRVGIDVNSLISIKSAPATYFSDVTEQNISLDLIGRNAIQMWLDYSKAEKLLNVTVAPITIPKPSRPLLSESINLSQILSDFMYVGFSASTGLHVSDQYILGWSFNKSGHAQNLNISKLPSFPPLSPESRKTSQKPRQIIIVLAVAVVVVMITIGGVVYIVRKKKYEEVWEDWEREYGPQRFSY
ncbi:hypothetical protein ACOSP7_024932 [Xanthoceras sorbifolium]